MKYDLVGNTYGYLTVIEHLKGSLQENTHSRWLCRCKCGRTAEVKTNDLLYGNVVDCGCLFNKPPKSSIRKGE